MAKKGKYIYEYPHPAVTADCAVFGFDGKELKVLLIKRGAEKEASTSAEVGKWALPGGFLDVDKDKTIADTAIRELREETGLSLSKNAFREVGTFSEKGRDPRERVITVAHYALVKMTEVQAATDAEKAEWFSLENIPQLAFDHDRILTEAFERLRQDIHFRPVGFDLMPDTFTLTQLQHLKHYGILDEKDDGMPRKGTRTPIQYSFDKENYEKLKSKGFQLEF